jgi:small subunit ribosomal protein S20
MANTKSAQKRAVKNLKERERNRALRSRMRTEIKKVRRALEAGNSEIAALLDRAIRVIDKTAQKKVIHKNAAARYKSRLIAAVASVKEAS